MTSSLFGTDGIRGKAGEGILVPESLLKLGHCIGQVAQHNNYKQTILVGHDGRRSAGMIESALSAGLLAEGYHIRSVGLITTPGLAYLCKVEKTGLGIMISASHNPPQDNGIKIFGPGGEKLADAVERAIESAFSNVTTLMVRKPGLFEHAPTLRGQYVRHLAKDSVPRLSLKGMKLVVDCANGGGSQVARELFESLGAKVHWIANEPNGDNINESCGALHPKKLAKAVIKTKSHLGISLDGDGDRCILADERGRLVDGDGILTAMSQDLITKKKLPKKTVVATVMSNFGLRKVATELKFQLSIVGVGDRRVVEELKRGGFALGGEQSGHIVFGKDNFYIGDGLYTALRVLDVMKRGRKSLSSLTAPFRSFPQILKNVPVRTKPPLDSQPKILQAVSKAETSLNGLGRVLVRYSGTEALARVMVEGPSSEEIVKIADEISAVIAQELS